MEARSNKLQAKDLINVGIFTAIYFVIFFAGMMLGYIPIFIPAVRIGVPHPVRYSLYAVLNEGQKIRHGISDWHYPWPAQSGHG